MNRSDIGFVLKGFGLAVRISCVSLAIGTAEAAAALAQAPPTVAPATPTPPPTVMKSIITERAITELEHKSILKGDWTNAITPPKTPVPVTEFLTTLARSLCIPTPPNLANKARWYQPSITALNALVPTNYVAPHPETAKQISRQDAVAYAVRVATTTHTIQLDAMPAKLPAFADEASIKPDARYAAKLAAYTRLVVVGPDNKFHPTAPLQAGDSAILAAQLAENYDLQARVASERSCR